MLVSVTDFVPTTICHQKASTVENNGRSMMKAEKDLREVQRRYDAAKGRFKPAKYLYHLHGLFIMLKN